MIILTVQLFCTVYCNTGSVLRFYSIILSVSGEINTKLKVCAVQKIAISAYGSFLVSKFN